MGKSKETVKLKRNGIEKTMPKAQWEAMKQSGNTYGWKLASDVSDETKAKESQIENSKIEALEGKVKALTSENGTLKTEATEKDAKIEALEGKVKALEGEVANLKAATSKKAEPAKEAPKAQPKKS